jgi:hypothetical protein
VPGRPRADYGVSGEHAPEGGVGHSDEYSPVPNKTPKGNDADVESTRRS